MILTAGEIANPDYTAQTWHIYLVFLLLLIVEGLLTMNSTKFHGQLNELGTILNLIGLLVFVIWFLVGSINHPKSNNSHYVWTRYRQRHRVAIRLGVHHGLPQRHLDHEWI